MGDVIGFDITPNSGSSLRKVLRLELTSYMVKLEAISVAATQEHALELTLKGMKAEWEHVKFSTVAYRLRNNLSVYLIIKSSIIILSV